MQPEAVRSALDALKNELGPDPASFLGVVGIDIGSSLSSAWHSIFQTCDTEDGEPRLLTNCSVEWQSPESNKKEHVPTVCTETSGTRGPFLTGHAAINSGLPLVELLKLQASIQDKQLKALQGSELTCRIQNQGIPVDTDKTLGEAFQQLSIACQHRDATKAFKVLAAFVKRIYNTQIWPHICSKLLEATGREPPPHDVSLVLVITVPVYWATPEWAAWLKTFHLALDGTSIKTMRIMTEPQAVFTGIAHNEHLKSSISTRKTWLVCDLGGGTADMGLYELVSTKPVQIEEVRSHQTINFRKSGLFGSELILDRLKFLVGQAVNIVEPVETCDETKAELFQVLERRFHAMPEEEYSDDEEFGKDKKNSGKRQEKIGKGNKDADEPGKRKTNDRENDKDNDDNEDKDNGKHKALKDERARLNLEGDFRFGLQSLATITKAQVIELEKLGLDVRNGQIILSADLFRAIVDQNAFPIAKMIDDGVTGAIERFKWRQRYGRGSKAKKVALLVVGGLAKNLYVQGQIRFRVRRLIDVIFLPDYQKSTISEGAVWYVLSGASRRNPAMAPPALKRGWVEDIPFDLPKESAETEDSERPEQRPRVPKGTVYFNDRLCDVAFMTETGSGVGHVNTRSKVDSRPCINVNHELTIDLVWSFDARDESVVGPAGTHLFGRPNFYAMGDPDNLIRRIANLRIQFKPEWSDMLLRSIIHAHGESGSAGVFEFKGKLDHEDLVWHYEFIVPLCGHFECAPKPRPVRKRSSKKKGGKQRAISEAEKEWMAEQEMIAAKEARAWEKCSQHKEGDAHTLAVKCSGTMNMVELIKFEDLNAGPCKGSAPKIMAENVELIEWPIDTERRKRKRDASTAAGPSQKTPKVTSA